MTDAKKDNGVLVPPADALAGEVHIDGGPLQIELRGWEVAKAGPGIQGWERVGQYQPSERGRKQAYLSSLYLDNQARKRKLSVVYKVRPIISVDFDAMFAPPPAALVRPIEEQALILTADDAGGEGAPQVEWQLPLPGMGVE